MAEAALKEESQEIVQRTPKQIAWGRFKRNKVGVYAACATAFFLSCSILAPLITRAFGVDNTTIYDGVLNEFAMPIGKWGGISWQHPLGIEPGVGRDVFALLLYGSQLSFLVAFIATGASIGLGMLIGIATGYFKGKVDASVGRFADFLMSFPGTFMIIALSLPLVPVSYTHLTLPTNREV